MSRPDYTFVCSRCCHRFEFVPGPTDSEERVKIHVKCPECGTGYVKRQISFPKGYANEPHS